MNERWVAYIRTPPRALRESGIGIGDDDWLVGWLVGGILFGVKMFLFLVVILSRTEVWFGEFLRGGERRKEE